jgi:hypothetical protein
VLPDVPLRAAEKMGRAMSEKHSYSDLLRDPRWQKRRLEIMGRAGFACEECGDDKSTLNVHHRIYRKGAMPWEYSDSELACICENCHQGEHYIRGLITSSMSRLSLSRLTELAGYAEGLEARDAVFTDPEEEQRDRQWPIRSLDHGRGFLIGASTALEPGHVQGALERSPLKFADIQNWGYRDLEEISRQ